MSGISHGLPFTHAIAAARELADGASLASVADTLGTEVLIGLAYLVAGYALLRAFEWQGRKHATLEQS
jgi:ABC-2 type transport system permease protein